MDEWLESKVRGPTNNGHADADPFSYDRSPPWKITPL
jgi:hypothetical protein